MLFSMTGFGSKTICLPISKKEKIQFLIEIKSVNSRFFETTCRLPSALNHLEISIIQKLKSELIRGRVYFSIRPEEENVAFEVIKPSLNIVQGYIDAVKEIKTKFKVSGEISVNDILNLPDVFVSKKTLIDKKLEKEILKQIDLVTIDLLKSRAAEGKNLQKDLEKRFYICEQIILKVDKLFQELMKKYKIQIQEVNLLSQESFDEQTKLKLDELYSILNKIDIHEEIIRFKSHISRISEVLKTKEIEKGKRLDFILQELLREANTILAKCSDSKISSVVVDIKVELEKAREQAQNIV
ncbi:YicC family protein [Candidatus Babeliales bacterium]|nr:YicC family protein [Candidatus Babeliales bacterium]MCF7899569.1 YicC family protein [Candidatus Babeliales bacterium]